MTARRTSSCQAPAAASGGVGLARAHERERQVGLAQRVVQAPRRRLVRGEARRRRAPTGARRSPARAPRRPTRSPGSSASSSSPRRRTRPPGAGRDTAAAARSPRRAGRHTQRDGARGQVDAQPPGARDERLGLQRGAAQVVEQGARGARAVAGRVAHRRQGERGDRRQAQDRLGARRGRAPVVEQHDRADMLAVGADGGVGHVARRQRARLPGQPRGDEAPNGGQAALARPRRRPRRRPRAARWRRPRRWPRRSRAATASRPSPARTASTIRTLRSGAVARTGPGGGGGRRHAAILYQFSGKSQRMTRPGRRGPSAPRRGARGPRGASGQPRQRAPGAPGARRPCGDGRRWPTPSRSCSRRGRDRPGRWRRARSAGARRGRAAGPMLVATQAASSSGSDTAIAEQQPPRAGRGLLDVELAAARQLEHDARLAQRVVQALGAGSRRARGRPPCARPAARRPAARRPSWRARRRRPAGGEQRPHDAVLLQRGRAGELLGDGGNDPARAVGLLGAQADRSVDSASAPAPRRRRRPAGPPRRRRGARAARAAAWPRRRVPGASRTRASATSAVRACRSPRGAPDGASWGAAVEAERDTPKAEAASRPFARGQDRACRRLAFAMLPPVTRDFTWRDGERIVRFGRGALAEAPDLLGDGYVLLTTPRAAASAPAVVAGAAAVHHVPTGRVDEVAGDLLDGGRGRPARRARRRARGRRRQGAGGRPRRRRRRDPDDAERRRDDARAPPRPRRRSGHAARAPADRAQRPGAERLAARGASWRRRRPTRSATRSRAR